MRYNNRTNRSENRNAAQNERKSLTLAEAFGRIIAAAERDFLDTNENANPVLVYASKTAKKDGKGDFYTMMASTAVAKIAGVDRASEVWNKSRKRYEIDADLWAKAEKAWTKAGSKVPEIGKSKDEDKKPRRQRSTESNKPRQQSKPRSNKPDDDKKPRRQRRTAAADNAKQMFEAFQAFMKAYNKAK